MAIICAERDQRRTADRNMCFSVATIVTQCVVDKNDLAFKNPTKPIGLYTKEEAEKISMEKGHVFKEDAGQRLAEELCHRCRQ